MHAWDNARRPRILVVDDDAAIVEVLCMRLDLMGLEPKTASNGRQALERIKELNPAAMILDINMPQLDGFGVLAQLGPEGTRRLPTLVLTARNQPEDVRRAIALGARDYLSKPFDQMKLVARITRLMRIGETAS